MVKDEDELLADTQEMEPLSAKDSFSAALPLPSRVKLSVEIIGGPDRGTTIDMTSGRLVIGRSDADLVLEDPKISKKHAVIEAFASSKIYVRDLASKNGTMVNGIQVAQKKLSDGDVIQLGDVVMRFRCRTPD
jgi:pSer/pThr/pTyr-binding forkhead associated (FHA) protein